MNTPEDIAGKTQRAKEAFPGWTVTHTHNAAAWRQWTASRRLPLAPAERAMNFRQHLAAATFDGLLQALGTEAKLQDLYRAQGAK